MSVDRDEIIRMAREAGFEMRRLPSILATNEYGEVNEELERFAALVAAAERMRLADELLMGECMEMVHADLIQYGVIDRTVPPMMVPEAVFRAVHMAIAAEREACEKACEEVARKYEERHRGCYPDGMVPAEMGADDCVEAIRARGVNG